MSGPVQTPLKVTESDGSPSGRPITEVVVSNGDLSISGVVATVDTTGSTTSPGGADSNVQYNNAGAFAGDAGFFVASAGGGDSTKVRIGALNLQNNSISPRSGNDDVILKADGSGEIGLQSSTVNGGTWTDSIVKIMCNTNADDAYLKFRSQYTSDDGGLMKDGNQDIILRSLVANKDIDFQVNGTGQVEVQNTTTDSDSVISIMGNGTGAPRLDLQNASKRVWIECQTNKKLTMQGGSGGDTFVFDVSSASGGITFPDSTVQTTAASGGGDNFFAVETPDPTLMANSEMAMIPATTMLCGYGGSSTQGVSTTTHYFPFIAPHSGDVDSFTISVSSSGASTFQDFGIYDNTDGFPDTLIGKANIDVSSTGEVTQTTLSATITLVKGTMYWLGWSRESGTNFANLDCVQDGGNTGVSFGLGVTSEYGMTSESNQSLKTASSGALPATVTLADLVASNRDYPIVGLAW